MKNRLYLTWLLLFYMNSFPVLAMTNLDDQKLFEKIFTNWTTAFNHKDLHASCDLFSKSVIANYQGQPKRNFKSICDGFSKIFSSSTQRYHYSFKLHNAYRSGSLAALRITWFLHIYENNKLKSTTQDEGMDIFEQDKLGRWKIVNYIAYGNTIK